MKRILSLMLVFVLCLVPMNVFAAEMSGADNQNIDLSGKLVKIYDAYTASEEWFVEDYQGNQHRIIGYLPGMTEAFDSYVGLNITISGVNSKYYSSTIIVKQIDYTRYVGTAEKVLVGKLAYRYDSKADSFKYYLTSACDGSKYELKDYNNVLDPLLIGENIVISGSIYPCPYFSVDKIY